MSPRHSLLLLLGVLLPLLLLILAAPTSALVPGMPEAAIGKGADPDLQHDLSLGQRRLQIHRQRQSRRHLRKPVRRSDGAAPLILPRDLDLSPTLAADSPAISATTAPIITTTSPPPSIKPRKSRRTTTPPSTQMQKRQADVAGAIDDLSKRTIIIIAGIIGGIIVALILMCVIRNKQGKEPCPCGAMPIDCCPTF